MSSRPIIFLGPSLSYTDACLIVDADFLPPVRAGDLDVVPGGSIVGIIDGVLDAASRLPPREAERALARGVHLYGAASTGALLAARLHVAGFIGLGRVFELVACHPDAAEDLVAVLYAGPDGAAFTKPLVNAVLTFIDRMHSIDPHLLDKVIEALRAIPIEGRTQSTIESILRDLTPVTNHFSYPPTLRNYKAADARLLLQRLAKPIPACAVTGTVSESSYCERRSSSVSTQRGGNTC